VHPDDRPFNGDGESEVVAFAAIHDLEDVTAVFDANVYVTAFEHRLTVVGRDGDDVTAVGDEEVACLLNLRRAFGGGVVAAYAQGDAEHGAQVFEPRHRAAVVEHLIPACDFFVDGVDVVTDANCPPLVGNAVDVVRVARLILERFGHV